MYRYIFILKYTQYLLVVQEKDNSNRTLKIDCKRFHLILFSQLKGHVSTNLTTLSLFIAVQPTSGTFVSVMHLQQGYESTNILSPITIRPPVPSAFALNRPDGGINDQRPKLRNLLNGYILISVVHFQNQLVTPSTICYSLTTLRIIAGQYQSQTSFLKQSKKPLKILSKKLRILLVTKSNTFELTAAESIKETSHQF